MATVYAVGIEEEFGDGLVLYGLFSGPAEAEGYIRDYTRGYRRIMGCSPGDLVARELEVDSPIHPVPAPPPLRAMPVADDAPKPTLAGRPPFDVEAAIRAEAAKAKG